MNVLCGALVQAAAAALKQTSLAKHNAHAQDLLKGLRASRCILHWLGIKALRACVRCTHEANASHDTRESPSQLKQADPVQL
jgi:threonine/homoserine/homoserine lactone efflux protein